MFILRPGLLPYQAVHRAYLGTSLANTISFTRSKAYAVYTLSSWFASRPFTRYTQTSRGFCINGQGNWKKNGLAARFRGIRQYSAEAAASIRIIRDVPELRSYRNELRQKLETVGLVPTMGALHEGHLSLAKTAAAENQHVFVSIYVNPTQFGVNEDLDAYPRTLNTDLEMLEALNRDLATHGLSGRISAVFVPTTKTMYPTLPPTSEIDGEGSFVTITPLGKRLEGASRPVFFRGVATVCMKLFNIVQATRVYFGQKDVQQSRIIKRLVKDFHIDTEVRICSTSREKDGLAMSSRNVYLGSRRRGVSTVLSKALKIAEQQCLDGKTSRTDILSPAWKFLDDTKAAEESKPAAERALFEIDYISLSDPDSMVEIDDAIDQHKGAIISGAMIMSPLEDIKEGEDVGEGGGALRPVRLIDNIIIPPI